MCSGQLCENISFKNGVTHIARKVFKNAIEEGQYFHKKLNGFGRVIDDEGNYEIGWYLNHLLHGYAKRVFSDGSI